MILSVTEGKRGRLIHPNWRQLGHTIDQPGLVAIAKKRPQTLLDLRAGCGRWIQRLPSGAKVRQILLRNFVREEDRPLSHEFGEASHFALVLFENVRIQTLGAFVLRKRRAACSMVFREDADIASVSTGLVGSAASNWASTFRRASSAIVQVRVFAACRR